MNDSEREKVFWYLKRCSSLTLWSTIADHFDHFCTEYQYAIEHADVSDVDSVEISNAKYFLDGKIAFDKGLALLSKGDRECFRYHTDVSFHAGIVAIELARELMNPQEFIFDWMPNKLVVVDAYSELDKVFTENIDAVLVIEPEQSYDTVSSFDEDLLNSIGYKSTIFPSVIGDVPRPCEDIVESNNEVFLSGIWEPEWNTGEDVLVRGCLNYFVAGRIAPSYALDENSSITVRWRLIWEDRRYEDGRIPEEEKTYFAKPEPEEKATLKAMPGEICPKSGYWVVRHHDHTQRHFKQGEVFPELNLPNAATIWRFVKE